MVLFHIVKQLLQKNTFVKVMANTSWNNFKAKWKKTHMYVSRELYHYDEFLSLPVESVCRLISSDRLTVTTEEQVQNFVWKVIHIKFYVSV